MTCPFFVHRVPVFNHYSKKSWPVQINCYIFMINSPADTYEVVGMVCSLHQYFDISYRTLSHL